MARKKEHHIYRDGELVATVESARAVYEWMHRNTAYSVLWAVTDGGWTVTDADGVSW